MEVFQTSLKRLFRFKLSFFLSITCVSIISYPSHAAILTNNKFNDTAKSFSWEFTWDPRLSTDRGVPVDLLPDRTKDKDQEEQWRVSVMLKFPFRDPSTFTFKGQHIVKFEDTDARIGKLFQETIPTNKIEPDVQPGNLRNLFTKSVEHIHNPDNHKDSYQLNYEVLANGNIYFHFSGVHISDHPETPELSSPFSLLALGTIGAASTLKRKLKSSQSTEKETTKVG